MHMPGRVGGPAAQLLCQGRAGQGWAGLELHCRQSAQPHHHPVGMARRATLRAHLAAAVGDARGFGQRRREAHNTSSEPCSRHWKASPSWLPHCELASPCKPALWLPFLPLTCLFKQLPLRRNLGALARLDQAGGQLWRTGTAGIEGAEGMVATRQLHRGTCGAMRMQQVRQWAVHVAPGQDRAGHA